MEHVRIWIAIAAISIEALAIAIMVGFIAIATVRWLIHMSQIGEAAYERYRVAVGKSLMVGLELLIGADIIRTVALDSSLNNIAILSALVVVRTFLSWTLTVEVDGRWPWQKGRSPPDHQRSGAVHAPSHESTAALTET
jgi:uncharacterized membrane protein